MFWESLGHLKNSRSYIVLKLLNKCNGVYFDDKKINIGLQEQKIRQEQNYLQ